MLATFNTIAAHRLPGLTAALAEAGLWNTRQSLTYANRGLDPQRRLETLLVAARRATGKQIDDLAQQALAALAAVSPDDTQAALVAEVAASLPPAFLPDVLRVIAGIENMSS